ncbi:unnamed protein product [Symbiodinium sp. CCMP2456]|nr:unnamed protein product [Symbiodinium sp. CCMP2456]
MSPGERLKQSCKRNKVRQASVLALCDRLEDQDSQNGDNGESGEEAKPHEVGQASAESAGSGTSDSRSSERATSREDGTLLAIGDRLEDPDSHSRKGGEEAKPQASSTSCADWDCWSREGCSTGVQVSCEGLLSIRLTRRRLDVLAIQKFCAWFPTELHRLKQVKFPKLYVSSDDIVLAHDVDLSQNDLDDEAMRILLLTLKQARVVIGVAKFYQNRLGCSSARLLSQWIRSAPGVLFELHLSHNQIKTAGALELIKAVADTKSYPSARPGSNNWPVPLWLRLEHNDIREACFHKEAEHCLQTARPDTKGKLICWFAPRNRYGCRSDNCGHCTPNHCPVIHIPHLVPQRGQHW